MQSQTCTRLTLGSTPLEPHTLLTLGMLVAVVPVTPSAAAAAHASTTVHLQVQPVPLVLVVAWTGCFCRIDWWSHKSPRQRTTMTTMTPPVRARTARIARHLQSLQSAAVHSEKHLRQLLLVVRSALAVPSQTAWPMMQVYRQVQPMRHL